MSHIDRSIGQLPASRRAFPNNLWFLPTSRRRPTRRYPAPAPVIPLHPAANLDPRREALVAIAFIALWIVATALATIAGAHAMRQWSLDAIPPWPWW